MSVDEMDLIGRLGDVEPLPPETFEQARTVLRAAITVEGAPQVIGLARHSKRRRRATVARSAIAAGVAAAMVAVAFVATTSGKSPTHAASNHVASLPSQSPKGTSGSNHVASPLIRLAAYVGGSAAPTGNATLVARTTAGGTVYDLYVDNGRYFFSQTESGLAGQVSAGHDFPGGATFVREIAAAKLAASGDVAKAAQDMADAPDPSVVASPTETADPAALAAKAAAVGHALSQTGNLYDNWAWENSLDAIMSGSGDPQVRAGVLRILATLPDVTVTDGTSGDQPTLVLTGGDAVLGSDYHEQLTIDATTGIPLSFAGGAPGEPPTGTISYQVSRVTTDDIAAGKF